MGKNKNKKLYCFFGQWCYKHRGFNDHILCLKRALDEVEEVLGRCPFDKKKKK